MRRRVALAGSSENAQPQIADQQDCSCAPPTKWTVSFVRGGQLVGAYSGADGSVPLMVVTMPLSTKMDRAPLFQVQTSWVERNVLV